MYTIIGLILILNGLLIFKSGQILQKEEKNIKSSDIVIVIIALTFAAGCIVAGLSLFLGGLFMSDLK